MPKRHTVTDLSWFIICLWYLCLSSIFIYVSVYLKRRGFWWCLSEGTMDLVGTRFANIGGQIYRPHDANLMIESRFSGWSFSLKARELLDGFRCWSSQFCFRIRIRWCLGRQSEDVWTNPLDPSLVDHVAKYQRFWRENGLKTVNVWFWTNWHIQPSIFQGQYKPGKRGIERPAKDIWPSADETFLVLEYFFGILFTVATWPKNLDQPAKGLWGYPLVNVYITMENHHF